MLGLELQQLNVVIDSTHRFEIPRYVIVSSSKKCAELLSRNPALDTIKLSNMSVHLWGILEHFLYTGRLPRCEMYESLHLLAIASRMEISSLRSLLIQVIPLKLLRINCLDALRISHAIPCVPVKVAAMEFVEKHFHWVSLTKPFGLLSLELLVEILSSPNLVIRSEVTVYEAVEYWIENGHKGGPIESHPTLNDHYRDEYEYYDEDEDAQFSDKDDGKDFKDDIEISVNASALERQMHLEKLLRLVRFCNMDAIDRSFLAKISTFKDSPVFVQRFASYFRSSLKNPWPTSAIPCNLFSNHRMLRRRNTSAFTMAFLLVDLLDNNTNYTAWDNGWRLEVIRSCGGTMHVFLQSKLRKEPREIEWSYQFTLLSNTHIIDIGEAFQWDVNWSPVDTAIHPFSINNAQSLLLKSNSVQVAVSIVESPW